jgi:type I protein arginine methyltransferase
MKDKKLRRNSDLQIEWDSQGVLWASSREAGVRLSLPAQAAMLLDAFDGERSILEVMQDLGAGPEIVGFVGMLHERNILVDESFKSQYFQNYHLGDHHSMLRDVPRMNTYRDALRELITPETVVADCGTGTGILALFAAQAGAKKVYAIEGSRWIDIARQMAEANGLTERIEFVRGQMEEVTLPEKVDLIVSECMDSLFIDARMLPDVLKFRDRTLKEKGVMVPFAGKIFLAPVSAPSEHADWMGRWDTLYADYGLRFDPLASLAAAQSHRRPLAHDCLLAPLAEIAHVDLATAPPATPAFQTEVTFEVQRDGLCHGFAGSFDALLSPQVTLSTSPESPMTHWQQHYFPTEVREVQKGDHFACLIQVGPSSGNRRRLDATLRVTHERGSTTLWEAEHTFLEF